MKKIDRLGWAAGISFSVYGVRIGIRASTPEVLEQAVAHLPAEWRPASSPVVDCLYSVIAGGSGGRPRVRRYHLLYTGPFILARTMDPDKLFEIFENDLQVSIAEKARSRLFVHAGVVGWQGRAIVIPGESLSGKTTLVTALMQAGAAYYSDEYAVFDRRGRVHPYLRPLSIRRGNNGKSKRYPVEAFGGIPGEKPLPVGLIVFTEYQEGRKWRPRVLSPGKAALELLTHTVPARTRPKSALATIRQVVSEATAVKGVRGATEGMADSLLEKVHRISSAYDQ